MWKVLLGLFVLYQMTKDRDNDSGSDAINTSPVVDEVEYVKQHAPPALDIAKMSAGVLSNTKGFTNADALVVTLVRQGQPYSQAAFDRLYAKLRT